MWFLNKIIFGNIKYQYIKNWSDINKKENFILKSLLFLTIFLGIFPNKIFDVTQIESLYLIELIKFKLTII